MTIYFSQGDTKSSTFPIAQTAIPDSGDLRVGLTLETNYTDLTGLYFEWNCLNAPAISFLTTCNCVISFLSVYVFIVYVSDLKPNPDLTQTSLLILGIAAIFSTNPIGLLFSNFKFQFSLTNCILHAVFIGVYRLFLCIQMAVVHCGAPITLSLVLFGIAFGVSATIEATVAFDRQSHIFMIDLPVFESETVAVLGRLAFVCISLILLAVVFWKGSLKGGQARRLIFIAVSVIVTDSVTIVSQIYCVLRGMAMETIVPDLLFVSGHGICAAAALFFFRAPMGQEYENLAKVDVNETVFAIDQISEDEDEKDELRS